MPRGPKGEKRLADVIGAAVNQNKDPAAVSLGRKGGMARAAGLSAKRRKEIAKKAAKSRWSEK
jgi:hypothetical protein